MRLKAIEIQGFKSFPDKTKLTFEQDITAVIGPNGSGKSNISDAIRWVLGEQSNKQLRGKSMEDVIFTGTAKRKALGFAEVSLTLDNVDRGVDFDNDLITVTRRYFRSGESEYKINGATVRLKDINELFMDTGLGRDGYSMIGQGRIDEIVGSKSDERREIFEEAAGISKYRYRRVEAERRLDRAEDNLIRLRDIMSELEGRVEPLRIQSEKAQEFLEISGEKKQLEIGLWLNTLNKSNDMLKEQENKIFVAKTQYEKLERELTQIAAQYEISALESQKIAAQIDAIRRETAKADDEASALRGEIAVLENNILHNNENITRLNGEIENANADDETMDRQISDKSAEIEQIEKTAGEKTDELNINLEKLSNLADNSGDYSLQIEEKNKALNQLSEKISDSRVKIVSAKTSIEEIKNSLVNFNEKFDEFNNVLDEVKIDVEEINADIDDCDKTVDECSNVVNGQELLLKKRIEKIEKIKEEVNNISLDIGENERRIKILQDLERNLEGFSYAVKQITKESNYGNLHGIHGPVSRLIEVNNDYATAIEIALGASAQNIVVSNEDDAKKAISFLKRTNGGRATFLPLTAIRPNSLRDNSISSSIGFIGIASELIKYDSKYSDIISSLLGTTVIASDMDAAVAMAKKFNYKYRIVTLDGQIVNRGGSLTGGSHAKNAGLLNRAGQIDELNKKVTKLKKNLEDKNVELKKANEEHNRVNNEFITAQSELKTANEDKIRLLGELKLLDEQFKTAKQNVDNLIENKENSTKRIEELELIFAQSSQTLEQDEKQKRDIEESIQTLTGGRDKLAVKRNELSETVSNIRLELIGFTKDIENLKLSIEQIELTKQNRESRLASLNSQIVELEKLNEDTKEKIEQLNQMNSGFMQKSATSEDEIDALNKKRNELEQNNYSSRATEREKSDDKEKISGELARLNERKQVMEKQYSDIISKLYEEYELTKSQAEEIGFEIEDIPTATKRLNEIKSKIRSLGSVNVSAIEEYKEVSGRYLEMKAQMDDVEKSKSELTSLIGSLTEKMKELFVNQFTIISKNFTGVFKELFGGGSAELKLVDPTNILESGIDIIAQPPGKNISIIEQLSGGEKALIAVSIYFAIMKVNPPPFCLLDEVEAALDEVNVDKVAQYLRLMCNSTQFIVITHRRGTMEEADVLYGVTMQEKGVSKLLSIDVSEIEKTLETKVSK